MSVLITGSLYSIVLRSLLCSSLLFTMTARMLFDAGLKLSEVDVGVDIGLTGVVEAGELMRPIILTGMLEPTSAAFLALWDSSRRGVQTLHLLFPQRDEEALRGCLRDTSTTLRPTIERHGRSDVMLKATGPLRHLIELAGVVMRCVNGVADTVTAARSTVSRAPAGATTTQAFDELTLVISLSLIHI